MRTKKKKKSIVNCGISFPWENIPICVFKKKKTKKKELKKKKK